MDSELVNKLLEINRTFYSQFSADFSDSRSSERFNIEPLRAYLSDNIRLLDAGCGNGRLTQALERAGFALEYVGIDSSPELIVLAQHHRAELKRVRALFRVVDLTARGWSAIVRDVAPFDLIVALAVLHHVPSFDFRLDILREMRALLTPRGILVMSNWQFLTNERLRRKIVPWEKVGIEEQGLEIGDYLLNWKRGGVGYRYVHLVTESEVENLARASEFQLMEQFLADADLNLFSVLQSF